MIEGFVLGRRFFDFAFGSAQNDTSVLLRIFLFC